MINIILLTLVTTLGGVWIIAVLSHFIEEKLPLNEWYSFPLFLTVILGVLAPYVTLIVYIFSP